MQTNFEHTLRWEGCAILSKRKFLIEEYSCQDAAEEGVFYHRLLDKAPGFNFNRPRYLTAKIKTEDKPEETLFYLTCIHLGLYTFKKIKVSNIVEFPSAKILRAEM